MDERGGPAVVGGGIVGSFIALELARRGARPILIDPDDRPSWSSSHSFALISAFGREPTPLYLLSCHGIALWRAWAREAPPSASPTWSGDIRWTDDPIRAASLRAAVDAARDQGYPVRHLSASELRRRLPGCRPGDVLAASLAPDDGWVEPAPVIEACKEMIESWGGSILRARAELRLHDDDLVVATRGAELHVERVIVSAGAETAEILSRIGVDIPTVASSALVVVTEPTGDVVPTTIEFPASPGHRAFLRQRADGTVLIALETDRGTAGDPTPEGGPKLLARAARYFPRLREVEIAETALVWRAMPGDHLPVVGTVPGLEQMYLAVAPTGVTLAPVIGEAVAAEIVSGEPQRKLEAFSPARFGRRIAELADDIDSIFDRIE